MEKKISLTRSEVIKWVTFLAVVLSTFFALQYRVNHLSEENEQRKKENMELKQEIKELKDEQQETGKLVSQLIGTTNEINKTVKSIADAIYSNQFDTKRK
jgi:cell division protein FtsB